MRRWMRECRGSDYPHSNPGWTGRQSYQIENAKTGTGEWVLTNPAANREIEGYASLTSANRGGSISFFVNTAEPTFTLEIIRLGWYNGRGGRRMTETATLTGMPQSIPSPGSPD